MNGYCPYKDYRSYECTRYEHCVYKQKIHAMSAFISYDTIGGSGGCCREYWNDAENKYLSKRIW